MIHVKAAANAAVNHLIDLFGKDSISDIRLEEVELEPEGMTSDTQDDDGANQSNGQDKSYWLITISYLPANLNPLFAQRQRLYKIFRIKADSGEMVSMKIRQVA